MYLIDTKGFVVALVLVLVTIVIGERVEPNKGDIRQKPCASNSLASSKCTFNTKWMLLTQFG